MWTIDTPSAPNSESTHGQVGKASLNLPRIAVVCVAPGGRPTAPDRAPPRPATHAARPAPAARAAQVRPAQVRHRR